MGLRFAGAAAVLVHHIEQIKSMAGYPNLWGYPSIQALGPQGVNLFFVLSGFLITHLLLIEQDRTGAISISNFVLRRALRILPLYYLIVFLAFAIMPLVVAAGSSPLDEALRGLYRRLDGSMGTVFLLFLFLLPNIALKLFAPVPMASQCWSIGIEEQFYLIWPWVVRIFRGSRLLWFCGIVLAIALPVQFFPVQARRLVFSWPYPWNFAAAYLLSLHIEYLVTGALAAIVRQRVSLPFLGHPATRALSLIALPLLLAGVLRLGSLNAILYAGVILSFITTADSWLTLDKPVFRYLGSISYGIYMFHSLAIYIAMKFVAGDLLLYPVAFALTLAMAAASHHFFERPFLQWRSRFRGAV